VDEIYRALVVSTGLSFRASSFTCKGSTPVVLSDVHWYVTNLRYAVCKKCGLKIPLLPRALARGLENQKYDRVLTPFSTILLD
jgi:hypothetical protein